MHCTSGTLEGASGNELFRRSWIPETNLRARLVLVHGLGEHSGRYDHVGAFLADRGVAVHALDHQGHGQSAGVTGSVERFEDFLDDLESFVGLVKTEGEGVDLPLVMLGHSMGGLILLAYRLEKAVQPDLTVFSSPAIVPVLDPDAEAIDPTRLSRDEAVWDRYLNDPLVLRERVTDQLYLQLLAGLELIDGRGGELSGPILLIHGDADRLCSMEGARDYLKQARTEDFVCQIYSEGRHEMFNEINKDEVLKNMWEWLDARL